MIRSLALETSSPVGSLALARDGAPLRERGFEHGLQNAAQVVPIIDAMLREQSWKPADVNELYLSIGPGSFTGLRLGVTLCKALSLVSGARIVAVPTVRVLAENAPDEARHLLIVLDARRDQVYAARFERDQTGRWIEREPAHLDSLATALARTPRPVHLLGEGIPYHRQFVGAEPSVVQTIESCWAPHASVVARLGHEMARAGQFTRPDLLSPLYVRLPEAEEKRLRSAKERDRQGPTART